MEIETNLTENNYFTILYPNQNYKVSFEYKHWKKNIEEKMGKNGREIFCIIDNIILYQNNKSENNFIKCPKCKKYIYQCKYCKRFRNEITTQHALWHLLIIY